MAVSWREDPAWTLASYDPEAFPAGRPSERPPADAERGQPPIWASLYRQHRVIATWFLDRGRVAA